MKHRLARSEWKIFFIFLFSANFTSVFHSLLASLGLAGLEVACNTTHMSRAHDNTNNKYGCYWRATMASDYNLQS
jgi:hypothetical protein